MVFPFRMRLLAPLLAFLLLAVAACDDAPGVGIDLVRGTGGDPVGRRAYVATVDTARRVDYTGGVASRLPSPGNPQAAYAGLVQDPVLGTIAATGVLELGAPDGKNLPGFRAATVTEATLRIPLDVYYGDTTSAVTYELRGLRRELTSTLVASDSALATTDVIATVTASGRDSVVSVRMPATWIAANQTALRAETAQDSLHGFVLVPRSGRQIRALPLGRATLTAVAGADTAAFTAIAGATLSSRTGTPVLAPSERLLQDGFPYRLTMPFDTTGLGRAALARVSVVVPYDSTRLATPTNFLRPFSTRLDLVPLDAAGKPVTYVGTVVATATPAGGKAVFSSEALRRIFQGYVFGNAEARKIVRFGVSFSDAPGGFAALVVQASGAGRPYFVFTSVGQ